MPIIDINGVSIAHEIIGTGDRAAVITPGGRFSKDTPGVRALATRLADGGMRVLIWDRPNCGESDISFAGPSESVQNADALAGLVRALAFGPALLIGGSGGARETLLAGIRSPDVARGLFVLWISGGPVGIATLPYFYCCDTAFAAADGGMAAVAALPGWREPLTRNEGNRARLLAWDTEAFIDKMQAWAAAFFPVPGSPIPCVTETDLAGITVPVMVLRGGNSDVNHPRATSETIHALIPGADIAEPPWGDREWVERLAASVKGEGLFARWPLLAPQILAFGGRI